jgi:hypothetical protein
MEFIDFKDLPKQVIFYLNPLFIAKKYDFSNIKDKFELRFENK